MGMTIVWSHVQKIWTIMGSRIGLAKTSGVCVVSVACLDVVSGLRRGDPSAAPPPRHKGIVTERVSAFKSWLASNQD